MRTTLTLDDDVAKMLDRARKRSPLGYKQLVNDLLRAGLSQSLKPKPAKRLFKTTVHSSGRCLVGSIDNIEEVLDLVEGPLRR